MKRRLLVETLSNVGRLGTQLACDLMTDNARKQLVKSEATQELEENATSLQGLGGPKASRPAPDELPN